jgi:ATP-dependent DNA ligase
LQQDRFVVDGEIAILAGEGFDFGALLKRVHPARSRVERLRSETPASFVAFDLLAEGDDDLRQTPFVERRRRLEALFAEASPPLVLTPLTADVDVAGAWLGRYTGRGVDGVVAKRPDMPYTPGRREWVKVKPERTADCVVAGFRPAAPGVVASLLLGLYDDEAVLRHIGVASSFTGDVRRALFEELSLLGVPLHGHPWQLGFGIERRPMGRLRGAAGAWTPELVQDWVPVRPERVCEVTYDQLDLDRFRHPARFRRWRPDRDPLSCRFDQFEAESPIELIPA